MRIEDVVEILGAEVLTEVVDPSMEITSACGADLMSDVMAFVKENVLLLTGLVNPQVIRTAEMMDIKVIVFVRGKNPGEAVIKLGREKGITVLTTKEPMFIACGKLYHAGLTGKGVRD